jgi:hypothetical protein
VRCGGWGCSIILSSSGLCALVLVIATVVVAKVVAAVFSYETHLVKSRDSSVGIALGYGLDDRGSRVRFPGVLGIFLLTTVSRTALGPTQSPIQWVPGTLYLGVKRPGREADHSSQFSAEVKNAWNYTSTSPIRLHGVVLS